MTDLSPQTPPTHPIRQEATESENNNSLEIGELSFERFTNWWRPNLIWFIPILSFCIAGWLMLNLTRNQGPTIDITFLNADGLEPGKTRVKYKSVDIGLVRTVSLHPDRNAVLVKVDLDKSAEALLAEDSRFWIVRPRITAGEISGLGTLLSGAYIGTDFGKSTDSTHSFKGLEAPPIITADLPGRQFVLHANDLGSLDIGSPIYYRRVPVGELVGYGLDKDGRGVSLSFFVHAPYDKYVTESSRFWHASGVDVALDASGIRVNTQSLTSIVLGGIAFDNPPAESALPSASANHIFTLQANRQEAFKRPDGQPIPYVLYFPDSVRGLMVGAPVDFRGVTIGEVTAIGAELNPKTLDYKFPVHIYIYPERLQARNQSDKSLKNFDIRQLLDHMVAKGLRGQLRTASLLTGQQYVAMDFFSPAPFVKLDWSKTPLVLPTITGTFEDLQKSVASIARKLDTLPLQEIATDLRHTLRTMRKTLEQIEQVATQTDQQLLPELRQTVISLRETLQNAQQLLASEAPLPNETRQAMQELARGAQAIRILAEMLERDPQALWRGRAPTAMENRGAKASDDKQGGHP